MDKSIFFKIPYGLCLVSSESNGTLGACIVNTAIQITDEPTNFVVSITKDSHTANLILESKKCIIGLISDKCSINLIKHFSHQSGNNVDKFSNEYKQLFSYLKYDNIPYLTEDFICNLVCDVKEIVDCDSHYLFVIKVLENIVISKEDKLMTYDMYRNLKFGTKSKYICTFCHYVYDGDIPFEELPNTYVCPICGKDKSAFVKSD